MDLKLLQLADSAFPSGGFAHSGGVEALYQAGLLRGEAQLELRLTELVWHVALGMLPFVSPAADADARCDVFLSNHVANRASRAQGAAFALAARAAFGEHVELPFMHLAPVMAQVAGEAARELYLFCAVRGALSAAVRLGAVGPLRAQALLHGLQRVMHAALAEVGDAPASVSPLLELHQAAHDSLYSRLFQS